MLLAIHKRVHTFFIACICLLFSAVSVAEQRAEIILNWETPSPVGVEGKMEKALRFSPFCTYKVSTEKLPMYQRWFEEFNGYGRAELTSVKTAPLTSEEKILLGSGYIFPPDFIIQTKTRATGRNKKQWVSILPVRQQTGKEPEKIISAVIVFTNQENAAQRAVTASYASNSVLKNGKWYRIGITKDGIYKLDYKFFRQTLGLNPSEINPQNIRIYGNGGGLLPFSNSVQKPDDLKENAIRVEGESDGVFDSTDFVWFFGQGPHTWRQTADCVPARHLLNLYSDTSYYFLNFDIGPGKRIVSLTPTGATPTREITTFDDRQFYENEAVNLILSGRNWYGEKFDNQLEYTFDFNFQNISQSDTVAVKAVVLSRSKPSSTFVLSCQSASKTITPGAFNPDIYYSAYGIVDSGCIRFLPSQQKLSVKLTYQKNAQYASAAGWLDYLEVSARRQLRLFGNYLQFRDYKNISQGTTATFVVGDATSATLVLDVTDPSDVKTVNGSLSGTIFRFTNDISSLREYVAFNPAGNALMQPEYFGETGNQDLHGSGPTDLLMVVHPLFWEQGLRLKRLHESNDGLRVLMASPQMIYNEFSSGRQDITAIKMFAKMFHDRASTTADLPKYMLLFGDASYNNKNRTKNGNTDFIPSYQSKESLTLTLSYVSDDYFGLLDDNEGEDPDDLLDIGIGRLPVKTAEEAKNVVDKIINYETKKPIDRNTAVSGGSCTNSGIASSGDWKNMICFVADDQDNGIHMGDADKLATYIDTTYKVYNIDKIYLDFYKQFTDAGGQRYPDVNIAINQRINRGALILNYTGHGGESGWALERILEVKDILSWNNLDRNPFFVTATCEFSRFDDPLRTSAGEDVILQAGGGGIGLLTTTRLVYSGPNFTLNSNFVQHAFDIDPATGKYYCLGDISRITKNLSATPSSNNHRNFTLLGDPALRLNYPEKNVTTTSVKLLPSVSTPDTLRALSKVEIKGFVADAAGNKISNFNGYIYPSVFDKKTNITNLRNDSTGPDQTPKRNFLVQKNILYKGKVQVTNGDFSFMFVVPKDIAYNFGKGKISYYGESASTDANGFFDNFIIGGTNAAAAADNAGPEIRLYMNDEKFIPGSITDEKPRLLAFIKDENGINTVGSGIGHDIMVTLDDNNQKSVVLNDYYQADLNSYQSGSIQYPFQDLSEGNHTLSLKVWDVYNNSSLGRTEFVVSKSARLALDRVMNYPNPFTTRTRFMFEHNRPCEPLDVLIQVFSVSGKLVKTLETSIQCEGFRSDKIEWDGKDEFGEKIGKGVYIYRLRLTAADGNQAEKFEKLVILN